MMTQCAPRHRCISIVDTTRPATITRGVRTPRYVISFNASWAQRRRSPVVVEDKSMGATGILRIDPPPTIQSSPSLFPITPTPRISIDQMRESWNKPSTTVRLRSDAQLRRAVTATFQACRLSSHIIKALFTGSVCGFLSRRASNRVEAALRCGLGD